MRLVARLLLLLLLALLPAAPAAAQDLKALVAQLAEGDFSDRAEVIRQIAATGEPEAQEVLSLLANGDLEQVKATGAVVRIEKRGRSKVAFELLAGAALGEVGRRDTRAIRINNNLRREVDAALGLLRGTVRNFVCGRA